MGGNISVRSVARHSLRALVFGAALVAMGSTAYAQGLVKVAFAGSGTWLGQVPIMVAIEKGYFKEAGIDVEFKTILNSSDRIRALTTGDITFSNLGSTAVITDMARGNESFYVFANVDDAPGNEGCWARREFTSFPALKGKKVAANSSAEITMHGLLATAGMSAKDIQFVNLSPNEMAGALSKGDVDAACVWQPLLDGLKTAVPDGHLIGTDMDTPSFKKFGTMAAPDIMIIARKFADEKPELAGKLAAAVFKGADLANKNPEEAAKLVASYFRKTAEDLVPGIKGFKYFGAAGWPEHIGTHTKKMQDLADWLADNKKVDKKIDVSRWVKTSFIPK